MVTQKLIGILFSSFLYRFAFPTGIAMRWGKGALTPPLLLLLLLLLLPSLARAAEEEDGAETFGDGDGGTNNDTDAAEAPRYDNRTYFVRPHPECTKMVLRTELNVSYHLFCYRIEKALSNLPSKSSRDRSLGGD